MFENTFQGGPAVELLSTVGANPAEKWKASGLQKDERKGLLLVQPGLVLQVFVPEQCSAVSFSLAVTDASRARRRLLFSSSFREPQANPLHAQFPLSFLRRGEWVNVVLDLDGITQSSWGQAFKSLDLVSLKGECRVRKVFTLRVPSGDDLPRQHDLPAGVGGTTQVVGSETFRMEPQPRPHSRADRPTTGDSVSQHRLSRLDSRLPRESTEPGKLPASVELMRLPANMDDAEAGRGATRLGYEDMVRTAGSRL